MKNSPKKLKAKTWRPLLLGSIPVLAVGLIWADSLLTKHVSVEKAAPQSKQELLGKTYDKEGLKAFWTERLSTAIRGIGAGTNAYPESTPHYIELCALIEKRYGEGMQMSLVTGYNPVHPSITAMNFIDQGHPKVELYLAAFRNLYDMGTDLGDTNALERTRTDALVSLLHEMDHLAYGYTGELIALKPGEEVPQAVTDHLNEIERLTWAITCDKTLWPLVNAHRHLMASDAEFIERYADYGRNVDDPRWAKFINNMYSRTRRNSAWETIK